MAKWLENNFLKQFMGGWVGHLKQWHTAKKAESYMDTSHVTQTPPPPPHTPTQIPSRV